MSSFWPEEADYLRELKRLLVLVDRAMGDEGIPADVRDRVRDRVLHGEPVPDEPGDWAEPRWPSSFDDLRAGAVYVEMGDDSNSGPGWPVRSEPPMHGGASVRRTLDESRPR